MKPNLLFFVRMKEISGSPKKSNLVNTADGVRRSI